MGFAVDRCVEMYVANAYPWKRRPSWRELAPGCARPIGPVQNINDHRQPQRLGESRVGCQSSCPFCYSSSSSLSLCRFATVVGRSSRPMRVAGIRTAPKVERATSCAKTILTDVCGEIEIGGWWWKSSRAKNCSCHSLRAMARGAHARVFELAAGRCSADPRSGSGRPASGLHWRRRNCRKSRFQLATTERRASSPPRCGSESSDGSEQTRCTLFGARPGLDRVLSCE